MSKLEDILKIGVPVLAAGAAIAGTEYLGISKYIQSYEFAKADLIGEFFGSFMSGLQYGFAYITRPIIDISAGIAALHISGRALDFARKNFKAKNI